MVMHFGRELARRTSVVMCAEQSGLSPLGGVLIRREPTPCPHPGSDDPVMIGGGRGLDRLSRRVPETMSIQGARHSFGVRRHPTKWSVSRFHACPEVRYGAGQMVPEGSWTCISRE
jgi:hypothetical protein